MPGPEDRGRIWQLQIHPRKTPLAPDVDFGQLAKRYAVSGGDIKNAVLKAASAAAAEAGPDTEKRIAQHHFESAVEEVISAKAIMQQSLFTNDVVRAPEPNAETRDVQTPWNAAILAAVVLASLALLVSFVTLALLYLR